MSRRPAAGALVAILLVAAAGYWFLLRTKTAEPHVYVPRIAAAIGSGSEAVAISADGAVVRWLPVPQDPSPPRLPLDEPPAGGQLHGPALQQARVLGAVPDALRPYVESSRYGEDGVEVVLTSGIELGFGDASQAARKWRAAATVLADPSLTALDYVDLQAPSRPSVYGSGHELPPPP